MSGIVLAGVLLCFSLVAASEISVSSKVDKSEINIGDRVQYEITVSFPATGVIELPSVLGNLGSFEVKEYDVSEPKKIASGREQSWKFIISTFTVGQYTLPPQVVEYTPENDTTKHRLYTEPIVINVLRSTPESTKDIADITGLAKLIGNKNLFWLWIILGIILLAVPGIYLLMKRMKKKRNQISPPKPPYEEAREALSLLRRQDLVAQGKQKSYCFALSEILRRYITRRFGIEALESTTEEFLEKIEPAAFTRAQKDSMKLFCESTDPVKFANFSLSAEEANTVFSQVNTIVEQTKPRIEVEQKPAGGTEKPESGVAKI
ncbi:MAG: DUF4381 family protein [Fibrobacteria bacterium]|nr:DUF4381 family protein [Fibrobacteria bacterium]